jgi:large subunit ribosomal protein L1
MAKRSKRYRSLVSKVPGNTPLPLVEAVKLLKTFGNTKFDQTVEVAIRTGIDARQADQMVRGSVVLPHGLGKPVRVIVFAKGDRADEAKAAGADEVGGQSWPKRLKGGGLISMCVLRRLT